MNARELLAAISGLPGARAVPVELDGIAESVLIAGIELARTETAEERALRRAWRERTRGGPVPLLLLADDPSREGVLLALGPVGHQDPIRVVDADALLEALRPLPGRPRLQAIRELAEQLERLDPRSTRLWDRHHALVKAMRTGDDAIGVPPYNGDLFAAACSPPSSATSRPSRGSPAPTSASPTSRPRPGSRSGPSTRRSARGYAPRSTRRSRSPGASTGPTWRWSSPTSRSTPSRTPAASGSAVVSAS